MKQNDSPAWHNAVAGGVAGAGSRLATAPLDLVRIRRQLAPRVQYPAESVWGTWKKVIETEGGIAALYRGNTAAILLWIGYAATQFAVYHRIKDSFASQPSWVASFGAGAGAGVIATLTTYPFDVCRTTFAAKGIQKTPSLPFSSLVEPGIHFRKKVEPPATLRAFVVHLYQQEGVRGFYAGVTPAIAQIIPYMGLNFCIYDALTRDKNSVTASAYAGSISGAISKLIVYPADTVKRRLQAQAFFLNQDSAFRTPYAGMVDCAKRIASEEGLPAVYRGVVPSVLKTMIASSLSFALFRGTKNVLEATVG